MDAVTRTLRLFQAEISADAPRIHPVPVSHTDHTGPVQGRVQRVANHPRQDGPGVPGGSEGMSKLGSRMIQSAKRLSRMPRAIPRATSSIPRLT